MSSTDGSDNSRWILWGVMSLIVIVGAWLRLSDLTGKSVTHVEMYVPGIRMPQGISIPGERMTLVKVLTGTFSSDTHPPGYYLIMWMWTKVFGTRTWALRLPAALLGIGSIPLVFWLGMLTGQRRASWLAATLLAVSPHHVFWSQVARMFTLACFLGLLATCLLLVLARTPNAPRWLDFLYVLVVLAGVSSHIFFWTILGTHTLWTFLNSWGRAQSLAGVAKLELMAAILGSPLLAFAAYQDANDLATLSNNAFVYGREFLQFAFLFPLAGFSSGVYPLNSDSPLVDDSHLTIARWLFFFLSLSLFLLGASSIREVGENLLTNARGVRTRAWLLGAGVATLAVLFFVAMAKRFLERPNPTLRTTEAMAALPFVIAAVSVVVQKKWDRLGRWFGSPLRKRFLIGEQALVLALVVIPFTLLTIVSWFKPIFNARGMLLVSPYLLLVLAWGMVRLSRVRLVAIALLAVVSVSIYRGSEGYRHMSAGRADYKEFAAAVAPDLDNSDLVFIQPSWYSTPIFYYLNSGWDRFLGRDYRVACRQNPHARVWILSFYDEDMPREMREALADYQALQMIDTPRARAVLYAPRTELTTSVQSAGRQDVD